MLTLIFLTSNLHFSLILRWYFRGWKEQNLSFSDSQNIPEVLGLHLSTSQPMLILIRSSSSFQYEIWKTTSSQQQCTLLRTSSGMRSAKSFENAYWLSMRRGG